MAGVYFFILRPFPRSNPCYRRPLQPDCSGNLWIADYVSNSIKFWSSSTQQMTTVFSGAGMFKQPKGITLDPGNANLYVVNSLSNTVSQVSLRTCIVSTIIGSGMTGAFSVASECVSTHCAKGCVKGTRSPQTDA